MYSQVVMTILGVRKGVGRRNSLSYCIMETATGISAGGLSMVSFLPQVVKVCRSGSVKGLSLGMVLVQLSAMSTWVLYGVLTDNYIIIFFNSVKVVCLLSFLWYFFIACTMDDGELSDHFSEEVEHEGKEGK